MSKIQNLRHGFKLCLCHFPAQCLNLSEPRFLSCNVERYHPRDNCERPAQGLAHSGCSPHVRLLFNHQMHSDPWLQTPAQANRCPAAFLSALDMLTCSMGWHQPQEKKRHTPAPANAAAWAGTHTFPCGGSLDSLSCQLGIVIRPSENGSNAGTHVFCGLSQVSPFSAPDADSLQACLTAASAAGSAVRSLK